MVTQGYYQGTGSAVKQPWPVIEKVYAMGGTGDIQERYMSFQMWLPLASEGRFRTENFVYGATY